MLHLRAPAKLNLYLRILGRRPDGYHGLETLFERIDLADELTFSPHPHGITLTCDEPSLDCGPENLITKASALMQRTCGMTQGAAIHLRKRVPIAGGLGGGSSDAAATLIGLTRLWNLQIPPERLRHLAAELGSDVPFFLQPEAFAIGRGRGEMCEPLSGALPELWHVLVAPPVQLSTKAVYEGFDRSVLRRTPVRSTRNVKRGTSGLQGRSLRLTPYALRKNAAFQQSNRSGNTGGGLTERGASISMCVHALRNGSLGELAKGLRNDLEPEAIRRCPVIQEIGDSLRRRGCIGVLTSGSGPSVFGLCHDEAHAQQVAHHIRATGPSAWKVLIVKTS